MKPSQRKELSSEQLLQSVVENAERLKAQLDALIVRVNAFKQSALRGSVDAALEALKIADQMTELQYMDPWVMDEVAEHIIATIDPDEPRLRELFDEPPY